MEAPSAGPEQGLVQTIECPFDSRDAALDRGCRFLLARLWDTGLLWAAFQQLVIGEADVEAGVIHRVGGQRPCGWGCKPGVRDQLPLGALRALAAARGGQESATLPKRVVVVVIVIVPQRRQQRLGLRTDARVLAGRAGAAVAAAVGVAERVEVSRRQRARRHVREGEAAAAAAVAALARPKQSRDV